MTLQPLLLLYNEDIRHSESTLYDSSAIGAIVQWRYTAQWEYTVWLFSHWCYCTMTIYGTVRTLYDSSAIGAIVQCFQASLVASTAQDLILCLYLFDQIIFVVTNIYMFLSCKVPNLCWYVRVVCMLIVRRMKWIRGITWSMISAVCTQDCYFQWCICSKIICLRQVLWYHCSEISNHLLF